MTKKFFLIFLMAVAAFEEVAAQQDSTSQDYKAQYEAFRKKAKKKYASFRDQANKKYAEFMEKAWKLYGVEEPVSFPIKRETEPVPYDKEKELEQEQAVEEPERQKKEGQKPDVVPEQKKKDDGQGTTPEIEVPWPVVPEEIITIPEPKPQPEPVEPVKENKETVKSSTFSYYGTPLNVRWGEAKEFKLNGTKEKDFADGYRVLTGGGYVNLLYDCLEIRKKQRLCDWAYYRMLQTLAESACGKGTNEAVFLQGVLLHQSGYVVRFAIEPDSRKLHLLSRINGVAYDCGYLTIGGKLFFLFDGCKVRNLQVCEVAYPGEKEMDLSISQLPLLKTNSSEKRLITSRFVSVEAQVTVNKNLISFFNDYPSTFCNGDFMTNWAYYANTPVSNEIREGLYPQLRKRLGNATPLMAANLLLNWVQMGLEYAVDQKVWGYERAFFAEESLYYPFCDCEDRAILYSHLIRDLLGLDVLLVYHPEHLYTAVCFNEEVEGDYFLVDGRKFTVADPTYYMANVGKTMSQMDNSKAKVILLRR